MDPFEIQLPASVRFAISRLESAGFEAYAVGGCVRDSLLCREPNDWDITTSARPEQTAACFADLRTIETGIQHGTLTVLVDREPLEITTFRRDGAYADNRHPISVTFSDSLADDLSRRDFTVNAMAYHPTRGLMDPFGGRADLSRAVIACVGDPSTRFHEDGLRILRAIRFSSVLGFSIAPETAEAIHTCKHLLANIAAERIRVEFVKLLCGISAVPILREYSDVIAEFIPELAACFAFDQNCKYHCFDVYEHTLHALEAEQTRDPVTRLAILLHDVGKPLTYTEDSDGGHFKGHGPVGVELSNRILHRLRFDNATIDAVTRLVDYHDRAFPAEERAVKRLMQKLSDRDILRLMEVQRCDRLAHAAPYNIPPRTLTEIPRLMQKIRADGACLSLKTLAVNGGDLIALGMKPGRELGVLLDALLDDVVEGRLPNERDALLEAARKKAKKE